MQWKKASAKHLQVFGSIGYAKYHIKRAPNMMIKSFKRVFIGYDLRSKGYKLYNSSNGKVVVSRDVEFLKEVSRNWEAEEEKAYDFA